MEDVGGICQTEYKYNTNEIISGNDNIDQDVVSCLKADEDALDVNIRWNYGQMLIIPVR